MAKPIMKLSPGMHSLSSPAFFTQLRELVRKNFIHLVLRRWLSTFIQTLVLPIVLIGVFVNIDYFTRGDNAYGIGTSAPVMGTPAPVRSFEQSLASGRDLVVVANSSAPSDIEAVIDRLREPLARHNNKFIRLSTWQEITDHCDVNRQGSSNCHAAILFDDSPLGFANRSGNWSYSILIDPALSYGFSYFTSTNPGSHDTVDETLLIPLQIAINSAIINTNRSFNVEAYQFARQTQTQAEADLDFQKKVARNARDTLAVVYLLTQMFAVYLVVNFVTTERRQGLSQLVDVMAGGAAAARVYSNVVTFSILYLPLAIVSGILFQHYIFPQSNAALLIFWSILATLSIITSAIFAASFFSGPRISSILVTGVFIALAVGGIMVINDKLSTEAASISLAFLFPSANYVQTIYLMARSAEALSPINPGKTWMDIWKTPQTVGVGVWMFLIFVVIQIFAYPLLAVLVEHLVHGVSFRRRSFDDGPDAEASAVAVQTTGLRKEYPPSLMRRIFCCAGRSSTVNALDGLDLVAYKQQVLCLLGVNGSGKSSTLDIIAGLHHSTAGDVKINAAPTKLGVCPQRNVLFPYLTVLEHVRFWSRVKQGSEDEEALRGLVEYCDLKNKINSQARELSGGQKRKLQFACMLAGGSTVCLLDEATTGLDPISRRAIFSMVAGERSKRSMIITTHFLDEAEVLADHIVLLSKGKVMCQGTGAELKNKFGAGYIVHIPRTEQPVDLGVPISNHQDRTCYHVANTAAAATLIARLEALDQPGIAVSGPTIEDVFLRLTRDVDETQRRELGEDLPAGKSSSAGAAGPPSPVSLASGRPISSFRQILILMRKRLTILPRYWVAPFLALALPIICTPLFLPLLTFETREGGYKLYEPPSCEAKLETPPSQGHFQPIRPYTSQVAFSFWRDDFLPVGPPSVNASLSRAMTLPQVVSQYPGVQREKPTFDLVDSIETFQDSIRRHTGNATKGGLFIKDSNSVLIAKPVQNWGMGLVGLWMAMETNTRISTSVGSLERKNDYFSTSSDYTGDSVMWMLAVTAVMAVYPCYFALYPAYERSHSVRALQYMNGVRPFPLWASHLCADSVIVLAVAVAFTATISAQLSSAWDQPGYMFVVSFLYGLASMLVSYLISAKVARTQLAAFMSTFMILIIGYLASFLAFFLPPFFAEPSDAQRTTDAAFWGLGVVFPITWMFKAVMVGLNAEKIMCRPNKLPANHIHGYGGPILLLVLQVIFFMLLLVWVESNNSFAPLVSFLKQAVRQKKLPVSGGADEEATVSSPDEISKEVARVQTTTTDLLRVSHVSKAFGNNQAVEDVTFGLSDGEILALLGPNGAGKTTLVNMITGELRPDAGEIFLRAVDVHRQTRLAQRSLGVCPQFDALDLMTARQHLEFYARIRGVDEVARNVSVVLDKTALTPHADKAASKLSGGNKRKLSLAIALIGNPEVLVLDEPSSAIDALAKRRLWQMLAEAGPGRSILLTTHSMEEANALATRAAIVSKRLLAIGTTQQLRDRYSNLYHIQLILKTAPTSTREETDTVEGWVRSQFGGVEFEGESLGGQVKFTVPNSEAGRNSSSSGGSSGDSTDPKSSGGRVGDKTIGEIITLLEAMKEELGILDYSVGAPTLEKVFMSVVKDNYVEEDARRRRWWRPRRV